MAQSPAHRFGQIIGSVLEDAILPLLEGFAREHDLYLDKKGRRPCRRGKKCSWIDLHGNTHDLDFVLERGGDAEKVGMPVAFIETAWRRYTKHSRNKAQEIQGAIEPLAETYRNHAPFKGAILAGVFTEGALTQLKSLGFSVLYFSYESLIAMFERAGVDAGFDENTPDAVFLEKIQVYDRLTASQKADLASSLVESHRDDVQTFLQALADTITRQIERIVILVLHGRSYELATPGDAIEFIEKYKSDGRAGPIERYEIEVCYNNGLVLRAPFADKAGAIAFLRNYEPVSPKVV